MNYHLHADNTTSRPCLHHQLIRIGRYSSAIMPLKCKVKNKIQNKSLMMMQKTAETMTMERERFRERQIHPGWIRELLIISDCTSRSSYLAGRNHLEEQKITNEELHRRNVV
ncbi:unnamed protein product [Lepidochelys olivacea]